MHLWVTLYSYPIALLEIHLVWERVVELRVQMDRWILSLKLSFPCFSPLISVDTRDFSLWTYCRRVFLGLVPKGSLFTALEVGQGINSIPRSRLLNWMEVVGWITRAKHSCTLSGQLWGICMHPGSVHQRTETQLSPQCLCAAALFSFPFLPRLTSLFPCWSFLGSGCLSLSSNLRVCATGRLDLRTF